MNEFLWIRLILFLRCYETLKVVTLPYYGTKKEATAARPSI